jgi:hypothetical protein
LSQNCLGHWDWKWVLNVSTKQGILGMKNLNEKFAMSPHCTEH